MIEYDIFCTLLILGDSDFGSQYWLVGPAPSSPSSPSTPPLTSSHLAASPWGSAPLASVAHTSAITPIAHLSAIAIAVIPIATIAIRVHTIAAIAPLASATTTTTSATSKAALVLGCDLLYGEGVAIDGGLTLLNQLLGCLLPLEGDEGKVLWLVVLALVHWPDHLGHGPEGDKVGLDLLVGHALSGQVAQVDLTLLGLSLLTGDLLSLDNVSLLSCGGLYPSAVLKQDEGKSSGPSSVRVSLQVDVFNLAELAKIFLDVCIFGLLVKVKQIYRFYSF